jgi:hypothetical protein
VPPALLNHFRQGGKAGFKVSKGMKTQIEILFYQKKFDFRKNFTNKFVQKGHICEASSINDIVKFLDLPIAVKNEKHFRNKWITGTPDVDFSKLKFQIDMKNVYYPEGLDTFDDVVDYGYEMQMHGYNWLLKIKDAFVIKILKNPPEEILEKEIWIHAKQNGLDRPTDESREYVRELMDYEGKQPLKDRINIYHVKTQKYHIDAIKEGVEIARREWPILVAKWETKNIEEIKILKNLADNAIAKFNK